MERIRPDGVFFTEGGRRFWLRGVSYGPFRANQAGDFLPEKKVVEHDLALVRELMSYLPQNNVDGAPDKITEDDPGRECPDLEGLVPEESNQPYDMKKVVTSVLDDGRFLEDFFYRINDFPLTVPPLRDRLEDVVLLTYHYIDKISRELGKEVSGTTNEFMDKLKAYRWPGNVRELDKVIKRAIILADEGDTLSVDHLPSEILDDHPVEPVEETAGRELVRGEQAHLLAGQRRQAIGEDDPLLVRVLEENEQSGGPATEKDHVGRGRISGVEIVGLVRNGRALHLDAFAFHYLFDILGERLGNPGTAPVIDTCGRHGKPPVGYGPARK